MTSAESPPRRAPVQSVLEEALSEWAERKTGQTPQAEVIAHANTGGWRRADLLR